MVLHPPPNGDDVVTAGVSALEPNGVAPPESPLLGDVTNPPPSSFPPPQELNWDTGPPPLMDASAVPVATGARPPVGPVGAVGATPGGPAGGAGRARRAHAGGAGGSLGAGRAGRSADPGLARQAGGARASGRAC